MTEKQGGQYLISEDCFNCFSCIDVCPAEAISVDGEKHTIDQDACIQCGACMGVCPVDAIRIE